MRALACGKTGEALSNKKREIVDQNKPENMIWQKGRSPLFQRVTTVTWSQKDEKRGRKKKGALIFSFTLLLFYFSFFLFFDKAGRKASNTLTPKLDAALGPPFCYDRWIRSGWI